jgi:2-polyprenyl-6-methoxyphenol hydroxylase-like FAD-dependent oxidoreductase
MSPPSRTLDVAVAGAGFAGLSAAALLARSGHRVTVFEKFESPQSVGAGILVQPSGLAAMRTLGMDQEVLRRGDRIDHLFGVTPKRRPVVNVRYSKWQPGSFGVGLHRGVLFDGLWKLAHASGVRVVTGHEVRELSALQDRHDLVVIADGSRSTLRQQTGLACSDRIYPWGAVWAVLQDPGRSHGSTLWQWYRGAHQMLGIMPTGLAPGSDVPVVSLFWSLHAGRYTAWREAGLDSFKREVLALHPGCGALLDQITSLDQLTWARYHDTVMPRYHTDRAVVIGDAAHATSPQLGQGTNLALLDAVALRDCLEQDVPVPQALERYTQLRRRHLHFYGQASRWLTPLFQSDLRLLPWLRDVFMNTASSLPVVGPLTRQVLVGVRRGWWPGQTLELAPEPLAQPLPQPETAG